MTSEATAATAATKRKSDAAADTSAKRPSGASLVLCTSGVYGEDLAALEKACGLLGARLVNEWSESVTHLVMLKVSWTPKLLHALASCVPVVNPTWVQRAVERVPDEPLPNTADPEFAPQAGGSTAGVAAVRPERASLFKGRRFISLPGAPTDTRTLLSKMGAEVQPWPEECADGEDHAAYYAARIAEGFGFLLPGDEKWPTAPESKAAVAAGGDVISPLLVRTSLIMGKVASARHLPSSSTNLLVKSGEN